MGASEKTIDRVILEKSLRFKELAAPDDTPPAGYATIYRGTDGKFYGLGSDGISTPVGSGGSVILITQAAHGFTVGANLYQGATLLQLTRADVDATSEVIGTVSRVIDVNNFELTLGGEITGIPLTAFEGAVPVKGSELWLSTSANGKFTVTKPSVIGQSGKPLGYVTSVGATVNIVLNIMRGENIGGTNAVVPRFLANGAKTLIQDFSNMDGGKVRGVLTIVSDTPLRNEYEIRFVKNGAGVYQGTATGLGGDAAGLFEMDNDGKLQCTIATHTNLSYARFDYQVNAPAVGAKFPIAIGESNVLADGGAQVLDVVADGTNTVTNLTATSPRLVTITSNGAAIHTVNLPTGADIKKGYIQRIECTNTSEANYIGIRATTVFEQFGAGEGFILVRALQDDPSLAAHWKIIDLQEGIMLTGVPSSGAGTGGTFNLDFVRTGRASARKITITGEIVAGTGGSPSSDINCTSVCPVRFRPARTVYANASYATAGSLFYFCQVNTAGTLNVAKRAINTTMAGSNFAVSEVGIFNISYLLN